MNRVVAVVLVVVALAAVVLAALFLVGGDTGGTTVPGPGKTTAGDTAPGVADETPSARKRTRREIPDGVDPDTVAVAGVVSNPDGVPVEGARISAHVVPEGEGSDALRMARSVLGGTMSDDELRGLFRGMDEDVGAMPTGSQRRRGVRFDMNVGFGPGAGRRGASGQSASGQAASGSGQPSEEDMRRGMSMMRRVMSEPDVISRFTRMARMAASGFEDDAPWPAVDETVTDASGRFRIEGLPAGGRVELRVTAARHAREKRRARVGDLALKIEMAPAALLTGEVRSEGAPLAGAEVRFRTGSARTGADGTFRWDGALPPKEPVMVSAPGHAPAGVFVKVPPKGDPEKVVIELFPAGRITGRITTVDGAPVRGAVVSVVKGEGVGAMMMFMPAMAGTSIPAADAQAQSGEDGRYALEGIPAGSVRLRISRQGFLDATVQGLGVVPRETLADVDVKLVREAVLEGRVLSASGSPVSGAQVDVSVQIEGPMQMIAQFMGGGARSAVTAGDGSYRVGGIPEGDREVKVEATGYLSVREKVSFAPSATVSRDFSLREGYTVTGVVLSAQGVPVSGARVRANAASDGANPMAAFLPNTLTSTMSGSDGRFELRGLPEGAFTVTATHAEHLEASAPDVRGGMTDLSLRLGAAATIRGVVVSEADGKPVAGATVLRKAPGAGGRAPRGMPFAMGGGEVSVAAGEDGSFTLAGLEPGQHEVHARRNGYADSVRVKVDVAGGGIADGVTLALPPGSSMSGVVVRRGAGTPVAGALVWAVREARGAFDPSAFEELAGGEPRAPEGAPSAVTKEDGTFVLEGLTPGKVGIEVRAAGLASFSASSVEVPGAAFTAELGEGGVVEGTVYAKSGFPQEGATVILQRGAMGQGAAGMGVTDRAGRYRIEKVPAANYQAVLMDPDSAMGFAGMKQARVTDGERTTVDFGQKGKGRVVAGEVLRDGKPFGGATLSLLGGSSAIQLATADSAGKFRFEGVEPGPYTVNVQQNMMGGGNASARVTVAPDADPAPVRLEISGLVVTGTVVEEGTGKPVALAQVVLLSRDGGSGGSFADLVARQRGQSFTGPDGRFTMEGVPAGSYDLRITANGYAESLLEGIAGAPAASAPELRATLTRGLELAVTVLGPDGKPVEAALVVPEDASGRESTAFDFTMTKQTGADGIARLRLQPGRYTLRVRASAFPEATLVTESSAGAVTVRLDDGGALEVVAVNASGQPVAGATLKVLDAQGNVIPRTASMASLFAGDATDATGRVVRENLRVGAVTVVVTATDGTEARAEAVVPSAGTARVRVTLGQ